MIDAAGTKVSLPRGASDASLTMYHVDRLEALCHAAVAAYPAGPGTHRPRHRGHPVPGPRGQDYDDEASILRAADFIGQLGDPNYLRKANALYYEFEEVGMNRQPRLRLARRHREPLSAIRLEQRRTAHPDRDRLSQQDRRSAGNGSPTSTATCSVPNAISRCPGRRNSLRSLDGA